MIDETLYDFKECIKQHTSFKYRNTKPTNPHPGTFYWIENGDNLELYFCFSDGSLKRLDNVAGDIDGLDEILKNLDLSDYEKKKDHDADIKGVQSQIKDCHTHCDGRMDGLQSLIESLKEILSDMNLNVYGYTYNATPEITENESLEDYKRKNPRPDGSVISLAEVTSASPSMPYIWVRSNSGGSSTWEIYDAKYVSLNDMVNDSMSHPKITVSLTYGSIVIDTDMSWGIFKGALKGNYGLSTNPDGTAAYPFEGLPSESSIKDITGGIVFQPDIIINPYTITYNHKNLHKPYGENENDENSGLYFGNVAIDDFFVLTLERWNSVTKEKMLTNTDAVKRILEEIRKPQNNGFKWSKMVDFYAGGTGKGDAAVMPITIKFPNGVFTVQDTHNLETDEDGNITNIRLNGSLTVFNSSNSYLQGDHKNVYKYRLDAGMSIYMSCKEGGINGINLTRSKYGTSSINEDYVMLTLLPNSA